MTIIENIDFNKDFYPEEEENIKDSLFKQYERVIIESLITSFGLDGFFIKDQHGGDVDTIYNVRQVGKDTQMVYKNSFNREKYDIRGDYDSKEYHSHNQYKTINRKVKDSKVNGKLYDSYTGNKVHRNDKTDLDHTISAKEIHEDRGRILADLKGSDLANSPENLNPTNQRANRTKKALTMDEFIERYGHEYTSEQIKKMKAKDAKSRKAYEAKLAKSYYTSSSFIKDVGVAAGKIGIKMGVKQAIGFVFTEIWFAIKEEFKKLGDLFSDLGELFSSIARGIKKGYMRAKEKYRDILAKLLDGTTAGILSSLTTTLCNMFFTTAKNVVKIIRQTYASLVEALKILFLNPNNLLFGERIKAVGKILSIAASVVAGTIIDEAIAKIPLGQLPILGEIISKFCGVLTTGILSCSFLYIFDNSEIVKKIVKVLDKIPSIESDITYYKNQVIQLERYAAELMKIDIETLKKEGDLYYKFSVNLENAKSDIEINILLKDVTKKLGVSSPWESSHSTFDSFMKDSSSKLVFR